MELNQQLATVGVSKCFPEKRYPPLGPAPVSMVVNVSGGKSFLQMLNVAITRINTRLCGNLLQLVGCGQIMVLREELELRWVISRACFPLKQGLADC